MADAGATTTVIPRDILTGLSIRPTQRDTFEHANGQSVELNLAKARARMDGRETTTWVIFGEGGMASLK